MLRPSARARRLALAALVVAFALVAVQVVAGLLGGPPSPQPPLAPSALPPVRFAALGDAGKDTAALRAVAARLQRVCAQQGCDFVLLLGDNAYPDGFASTEDPRWRVLVEDPYGALGVPVYPVLGNHDYGPRGLSVERAAAALDYAQGSATWSMPGRWYALRTGVLDLFALDTQLALLDDLGEPWTDRYGGPMDEQRAWLREAWAEPSGATWRVAFGHHPLRSRGAHGDAGAYDDLWFLPVLSGRGVRRLLEQHVCGRADVYLSGHDHNRQWLQRSCEGTQLVVSGAGASTVGFERSQPTHFADDQQPGFAWFEATAEAMKVQFWGARSGLQHEGVLRKPAGAGPAGIEVASAR